MKGGSLGAVIVWPVSLTIDLWINAGLKHSELILGGGLVMERTR